MTHKNSSNYYDENLNSHALAQVYDTALPRIERYLSEEIAFVREDLKKDEKILEVGAGYGRILKELAPHVASATGIDISSGNVDLGKHYLRDYPNAHMKVVDVHKLDFKEEFHKVLCLQNGLSAMKGDPCKTVEKCLHALVRGGTAYFSTYSHAFWDERLLWFEEQAHKGLLGEIDREATKEGVIVCKDGFRATTFSRDDLAALGEQSGYPWHLHEVDSSSLFLVIVKK